MYVRRFYDERLAQASYLIGCQRTGEAIVIDPARDVAPYRDAARDEQLRITRVAETHIHADFVSGARELAAATGAVLLLSGEGGPDWQYTYAAGAGATLLRNGDSVALGGVRFDVRHTPGHTPEHLSFLVTDTARSTTPVAMVTGDFVFVGDVGRPDLLEKAVGTAGAASAGAHQLFQSLRRLEALPDYVQIWPGHGAGSACGKALGAVPVSTLGYERQSNWAFQLSDEAAFVAAVLEGQPDPPRYFSEMKRINREGPPLIGAWPDVPQLSADDLPAAETTGVVLDVRPAAQYAAAHLPGTLNIPLNRAFVKWAGSLVPYDRDIAVVVPDATSVTTVQRALASIGLDRLRGAFGPAVLHAARHRGALAPPMHQVAITGAEALRAGGRRIIDLRDDDEWAAGHFSGAEHHPLATLAEAVATLDRTTPVAVHCQAGARSAIGASLLERMGFSDIVDLTGGWDALGR